MHDCMAFTSLKGVQLTQKAGDNFNLIVGKFSILFLNGALSGHNKPNI